MAKILMVDDSINVRDDVTAILEEAGHIVHTAANGEEGLEFLKNNKEIDLIITDLNMPEMDGLSMCQHIQQLNIHTTAPILMMTANASQELKEEGKSYGVTGWLVKPYNRKGLKVAIEILLKRGK